jgi:two-component system, sensor histidine kinase and response regulator
MAAPVPRPMSTAPNAPELILVVDDNEANRLLARHTLEDEGYRVVTATGGAEGIAAFDRERPDCVVLDVRMPEIDGFAVCEQIRARPEGATIPVLFLTALRDVDTFDRALRAGGDDFLTKPVRPAELIARVQTVLKLRRMGVELREHFDLIKHQRDDLLRLQLQKERLTAFVVHDLKNHVNAMDLHAQVLLRDPTLRDGGRQSAAQIRSSARQLNRMILNLLDISKADEGKLVAKRSDVDLGALLEAVTGELEGAAAERRVSVDVALGIRHVRADEDLLRRTLANLIENAIRHAPKGSVVRVTSGQQAGATEIRVADAGVGVPAKMRESIFDPFVRLEADEGRTARTGHGLGLAFCKLAVEAHGGWIGVEDAAPGAVFVVHWVDAARSA